MTPKELKRLSRTDLLEMVLELTKENVELRRNAEQLRLELKERNLLIEDSGSLAEASLKLSGVFQAAQSACDLYTENVHARMDAMKEECARMEQRTKKKCDAMLEQAKAEAREILAAAKRKAQE